MDYAETKYGFDWSCAKIERICSNEKKGWIVIGIKTPRYKKHLQIYITRTGKIRIYDSRGEWKRPNLGEKS